VRTTKPEDLSLRVQKKKENGIQEGSRARTPLGLRVEEQTKWQSQGFGGSEMSLKAQFAVQADWLLRPG